MMKQELRVDIQRIKTDQGGEFKNHQFEEFTKDKGIIHEFSATYTAEQNGFIERNNRTIFEATRSMLHFRELPLSLWAEAANTAVHIWNRTISPQRSDQTPYEQMFQQVPDVSYFRVFVSQAYLHIPKKQRSKLDAKSQKLIFVGYDQKGRTYRLWHPGTKRISIGTDVVIHETLGLTTKDPLPLDLCIEPVTLPVPQYQPTIVATTTSTILPTASDKPSTNNDYFLDHEIHAANDTYSDINQGETSQQGETGSNIPPEQGVFIVPQHEEFPAPEPGQEFLALEQEQSVPAQTTHAQPALIIPT